MNALNTLRELHRAGRLSEAARLVRQTDTNDGTLDYFRALGTIELAIGNVAKARAAFEAAVAVEPQSAPALNDLGVCLARAGSFEPAAEAFGKAARHPGLRAAALANLGSALLRLERPLDAERAFTQSLKDHPNPQCAVGLARAWARLGKGNEAEVLLLQVLNSAAADFLALDALIDLQLMTPEKRLEWAARVAARCPGHSGLCALRIRAAFAVDQESGLAMREPYRELVRVADGSVAELAVCQRAVPSVAGHPSMEVAPAQHATVGGLHSGDLFAEPTVATSSIFSELRALIESRVAAQVQALQRDHAEHPFVRTRPRRARLHAWAVVLRAEHYQSAHFHPDAWLSGCLYLQVPVSGPAPGAGCLDLLPRVPNFDLVVPQVARSVLFPSCLEHATVPHGGQGERLSVAFDVVPQEK